MLVYVDTSALIALYLPRDANHKVAASYLRESVCRGVRFVIGRPVLVEYLDGLTKRVGKGEAIDQLRFVEASTVMRVEPEAEEDHTRARELFFQYDDESIDMTDVLSFSIMERLGLRDAFTFDRDFEIHGFTRVPRP